MNKEYIERIKQNMHKVDEEYTRLLSDADYRVMPCMMKEIVSEETGYFKGFFDLAIQVFSDEVFRDLLDEYHIISIK